MSTLDEIRERYAAIDTPWWEPNYAERDRRTLLALLDAQVDESRQWHKDYCRAVETGAELVKKLDAQSLELQAVREALEGLFVACTTDSGAVLIGGAIAKARAALKQSRGAT